MHSLSAISCILHFFYLLLSDKSENENFFASLLINFEETRWHKQTNDLGNAEKEMHNFSRPLPPPQMAVCFSLLTCAGQGECRGTRRESRKIVNNSRLSFG